MNPGLTRLFASFTNRLVSLSATDNDLRADLRALARALLAATDLPDDSLIPENNDLLISIENLDLAPNESGIDGQNDSAFAPPIPVPSLEASPLLELTLGRTRPTAPPDFSPGFYREALKAQTTDADLPAVESHCRLKAEGIRWAATRRRRLDLEGAEYRAEIAPRDREILDRGGDLGCYLWMNTPDFVVPRDSAALEGVAGWFEALADAVALVRGMLPDVEADRRFFEPALDLLAEAQSALRVAIERIAGPKDPDQFLTYNWLREVAAREQIYIRHHMRLDDPADPSRLAEFETRLEHLDARYQEIRGGAKRRKKAMGQLRYHVKLIGERTGGLRDWRKVAEVIDELLNLEVPASNVEVREVILPVLDLMPEGEEFSKGFGLVLKEIDRYLANRSPAAEATAAEVPTAEVARVAELLKGKSALLIGGVRRPEAHRTLEAAFGLKDLFWEETREHESISVFEHYVARPQVALVLLAIRWSSHSFGEVKKFCDVHQKPMVRLPGGYGVNQVAAQIAAQCSEQLQGAS